MRPLRARPTGRALCMRRERCRDDPRAGRGRDSSIRATRSFFARRSRLVSSKAGNMLRGAGAPAPKALIVPHAGYVYSGPIAGSAYATLEAVRDRIERVVLLGPSHRVAFRGLALSSAAFWRTPLGDVPLDSDRRRDARGRSRRSASSTPRTPTSTASRCSFPSCRSALGSFALLPLVAGDASPEQVAQVLEPHWGGPETLIVVSSDLSHYHDTGRARARSTASPRPRSRRCGPRDSARRTPAAACRCADCWSAHASTVSTVRTLDLRNSGDTAGPRDRVVGYGAYAFA